MVQAKKAKPRRPQRDGVKKHGKQADIAEFRVQLDALGLKIVEVTADGNCFFRALADQLEGNQEEHKKYRDMVVQYILSHREDFEPFIEDEVPFNQYCQSMGEDGTWAGHMELQAASLVTKRNICIHRKSHDFPPTIICPITSRVFYLQLRSPRWYIHNFSGHQSLMIHLCYHDGEHYNSVRSKEDSCDGPAKPIIIKVDQNISLKDENNKLTVKSSNGSTNRCLYDAGSIKLVMAGTGCGNANKVEQVLQEVNGDVDAAIEFLIAEKEWDEDNLDTTYDPNPNIPGKSHIYDGDDHIQTGECADIKLEQGKDISKTQSDQLHKNGSEDKISRNKECSCGSKKKYKHCCGQAMPKIVAPIITSKVVPGKARKETKKNKKKEAMREVTHSTSGSSTSLPDMGALCI